MLSTKKDVEIACPKCGGRILFGQSRCGNCNIAVYPRFQAPRKQVHPIRIGVLGLGAVMFTLLGLILIAAGMVSMIDGRGGSDLQWIAMGVPCLCAGIFVVTYLMRLLRD